jgi:cytochrome c oxidase subunit II
MSSTRRRMTAAVGLLVTGVAAAALAAQEADDGVQHVSMLAMKFDYLPDTVTVKQGRPVELELSSLDRTHGFDAPGLGLHTDIPPGAPTILRFTPQKSGIYNLHCDNFCGDGHEGMTGRIIVTD